MAEVDLNFLARQIERLIPLCDDVAVLTAMVMRLDASQNALLQEVRAVHSLDLDARHPSKSLQRIGSQVTPSRIGEADYDR